MDNNVQKILDSLQTEFSTGFDAIAFRKISVELVQIAENNRANIEATTDTLQNKINNNISIISGLDTDIETMNDYIQKNQTLEERREILEAEYAELHVKKNQIEDLQLKKRKLEDNQTFINSFADDLEQINGSINTTVSDFLNKLIDVQNLLSGSNAENDLNIIITTVRSNLQQVEDVIQCLEQLPVLETGFTQINREINAKIEEHNNLVKQINAVNDAFKDVSKRLKSMQDAYKKHISSDKNIIDNLKKKGESWNFDIENCIKNNFLELDKLLEGVESWIKTKLDERKKLPVCKILERQGNTINEQQDENRG
jgi:DNA repair ATPase RecN